MTQADDSVFASLQQVAGTTYQNAEYNRDIIDIYLLRKAREKGLRLPTGGPPDEYKYLGAWVETSTAGTSHNVVYIDVSSMYPSLLMTLNASPETLIGTKADLEASPYTESECVYGYVDTRQVKHLDGSETGWRQFCDGTYKMVYDPSNNDVKWSCDEPEWSSRPTGEGPRYDRLYFLDHTVEKGFLTECVEELIDLKDQYRGTSLYGPTKTVTNCFTADTEVLTPSGVRNIRDLSVGDDVYSFDPDTETVEVKPVTKTFSYPDYDGEIIDIQTGRVDFSVTPNHRMCVRKDNSNPQASSWDEYRFVEAGAMDSHSHYELPHDWSVEHGEELTTVDLTDYLEDYVVWVNPEVHGRAFQAQIDWNGERQQVGGRDTRRAGYRLDQATYENHREYVESVGSEILVHAAPKQRWVPKDYDGDDFLQLLAWYITEGSSRVSGGDKEKYDTTRGITHRIEIAQKDDDGRAEIGALLNRMGLPVNADSNGFSFSSKLLYTVLRDLCGTDSFDKQLPELVFECSKRQKELVFETLIAGDGDSRSTSYRYTTSSTQLRDDVMRLCVHLGRNPRYRFDSGSWRVLFSDADNEIRPHRSAERRPSPDDEGVYCVEVADNHTLLAGRNGNFQFVGQSIYGVLGFATEGSSFRLFDWRLAEAITLCGRKMIQHSRDYVLDYLHENGYPDAYSALGDTDGVGISVPSASTRHEAVAVVERAVERLNGIGYDDFFRREMGVSPDHHHGEIEVESYAAKAFVPSRNPPDDEIGVKKRRIEWITGAEGTDGLVETDDISITGLEAQRSDVAPIIREAQHAFADALRLDRRPAREQLWPRLRSMAEEARTGACSPIAQEGTGDRSLARLCKRQGIGQPLSEYGTDQRRPAPIYRGAKYANEHIDGVTIQRGDKPALIRIEPAKTGPYPSTYTASTAEHGDPVDAVALPDPETLPEAFTVDYETLWQKSLRDPMEPLLATRFGRDPWTQILDGTEQAGFEAFTDAS